MGFLPLYKGANIPEKAHKGLLFDKFFEWERNGQAASEGDKKSFLEKFTRDTCGDSATLMRYQEVLSKLIHTRKGESAVFTNEWHFATGMGISHPLENGMAWHPVLGTPYLAGSAVKGLLRGYCESWLAWEKSKIFEVFGTPAEDENPHSGNYMFFDAIPVKPVKMVADVMTPHMGKWYESGGEKTHTHTNTPADWHAPVPVLFLAIEKISLLFGIAPRRSHGTHERTKELLIILEEALLWVGAGAKTAAGYGHFSKDVSESSKIQSLLEKDERERQAQEEAKKKELEKATMSPLERLFVDLPDQTIPTFVKALQEGYFGVLQCEAAMKIQDEMRTKNEWKEEGNPAKDKAVKRTKSVIEILNQCK